MDIERSLALSHCERLTRQFYRSLDRHEIDIIESIVSDDCQWFRAGTAVIGPAAIRQVLEARDRALKTRHVVANAVAGEIANGDITVDFDLLYVSDAKPAADQPAKPVTVLSGTDRYRLQDGTWRLVFKQATLQF